MGKSLNQTMEMCHVVQTFECADYSSVSIQKKLDDSPQLSNGGTYYVCCVNSF